MLKVASIWGVVAGVCYIIITWISLAQRQVLNQYPSWGLISTALYVFVLALIVFISMYMTREKYYRALGINFAQTFYVGVITSLVTGLIAGAFAFIYIKYIEPDFLTHLLQETTTEMEKQHKTAKEILNNTNEMKQVYTPPIQFMSLLTTTFFIGIICSSLLSIFVRNRDTFTSKQ